MTTISSSQVHNVNTTLSISIHETSTTEVDNETSSIYDDEQYYSVILFLNMNVD
jgi:hypothetical protein